MPDPHGHDTIPLFDLPQADLPQPARTIAQTARDTRPAWASYSGKRVACHECVLHAHTHGGRGTIRAAKRQRVVAATRERLLLCHDHAKPREQADKAAAA